jgi:hypothetical protein
VKNRGKGKRRNRREGRGNGVEDEIEVVGSEKSTKGGRRSEGREESRRNGTARRRSRWERGARIQFDDRGVYADVCE